MNLIDLISDIEIIDQDAIIFMKNKENLYSDIILAFAEEGDEGVKEKEGRKYYYLIEVFLANEFIRDWLASIDYKPSPQETAKRLFDYAINDA